MSDSEQQQEAEKVSEPQWPEEGGEWSDGEDGTSMDCGLLQAMAEEDEEINVYNEETFGMDLDAHGTTEDRSETLLNFGEPPPPPPTPPPTPPRPPSDPEPPSLRSSPSPPRQRPQYLPRAPPGQRGRVVHIEGAQVRKSLCHVTLLGVPSVQFMQSKLRVRGDVFETNPGIT
ncbi:protein PAT1 homolog 2 [Lates japonicus]|uniref:Protein PAT1 homolog 2 n=1 Tax=Lates japonicus TaxID=270547 RepID=A0AAD3NKC3_LATJO|nr:protein PAT1 homolog 2 [Lates japonicus]